MVVQYRCVNGRLQVTQNALTGISTIASKMLAQLNGLDSADATAVDSLKVSAQSALQQVAQFLNSKSGDTYVFSGRTPAMRHSRRTIRRF